jgi:hypothetical protein
MMRLDRGVHTRYSPSTSPQQEDEAVDGLKAAGATDTVVYASDAITVDSYGCTRIGDSN